MGKLFIVATPIGNLEDITLRAIDVLKAVALIAAEDTRTTRKLLSRYEIDTPLTSYHSYSKRAKGLTLLQTLKEKDVAMVSEAGTPGLSDPGYELICAAINQGTAIVTIPGPSAITTALVVSGLPSDRFLYLGFLPRRQAERSRLLTSLTQEDKTLIAFEAPHRLKETLKQMYDILGDRRIAVCRELTKIHEEVFRGAVSEALEHFVEPRGEFTLVIQGAVRPGKAQLNKERESETRLALQKLATEGTTARDAVARVANETGLRRREVYQMWLEIKRTV